jgi:hypothetical protein
MTKTFRFFLLVVAGAPLILMEGCGSTQSGPSSETEAGADAIADSGGGEADGTMSPDVGAEAGPDAALDVGSIDSPVDAAAELGPDATGDVAADGAGDVISDVAGDVSGDVVADVVLDVDGAGDAGDGGSEAGEGGCTLSTAAEAGTGGTLNWAQKFGATGGMSPSSVATVPSNGDVVIGGGFTGTVNLGGGLATSHGMDAAAPGEDTFVVKFDSGGNYKWARTFGNGLEVAANSVAVDPSGNVALAGIFQGSVSFGGSTLTAVGNTDIFIVEFSSTGAFLWSKSFGAAGQYQGLDTVIVDAAGNVLIAGQSNSADFGGGAKTGFYIAKFDSTGVYAWSNAFPATTSYGGPWLAVDASGDVILAGTFNATVDLGGGTLTSAGGFDAFVAKFDPSGTYQWAHQYGQTGGGGVGASISGVAVDSCANIFVTGNFGGALSFGTGTLMATTAGASYVFLAKLDPTGHGVWAKEFAGPSDSLNTGSLAVDGAGRPTIVNPLGGSADFGGGTLTSVGNASVVVASFDAAGAYGWSYVGGSPSTATSAPAAPQGVAAGGSSVVVVGVFGASATTLVLPGKTLTATSGNDMFIASFAP